jgi:hypothetical protein
MRKALLPMLASLLICGTATAALIATNAHAGQSSRKPMMVLAQNEIRATPGRDGAPPPDMEARMDRHMRGRGEMCENLYARKAGEVAFLEAKLQLDARQQPLFARWKDVSLDIAKRHEGVCGTRVARLRAGGRPDMMERLGREEDRLKTRLADIQAERPSLSALYASLTPTQQSAFARTARRGIGERMHRAMGMMRHGQEMGRRFGRGPDGEPPLPPPPRQ